MALVLTLRSVPCGTQCLAASTIQRWRTRWGQIHTTLFVFLAIFDEPRPSLCSLPVIRKLLLLALMWPTFWYSPRAAPSYKPLVVSSKAELPLRAHLYHLSDTTGSTDVLEAIKAQRAGRFTPTTSLTYRQNFGYNIAQHWWYFELQADAVPADLVLEMEYANLDHLELFELKAGGVRSLGITGDVYAFERRPISNNNYVYQLRLKAHERVGYLLHINQPHAILSFYVRLWQTAHFKQTDRQEYGLWGVFVGIALVVFVVNLVMLVATRDFIFFWYNAYLLAICVHLLADAGLGFQYCWPTWPGINIYDPVYLGAWLGMVAQLTFMQYFIRQNRHNSKVFWWLMAFKVLVTLAFVAVVAVHTLNIPGKEQYMYQLTSSLTTYFVLGYISLASLSLWEQRHEKSRLVRYYRYALWAQFAGYVAVIVINIGQTKGWQLPFDLETYVIMAVTVLIDMAFFSYGLAYRYDLFNRENKKLSLAISRTRQEAMQRVIETLEEERRRIAQDLHDDVGATLATAKGYLSTLSRSPNLGTLSQVIEAQRYLDQASEDLRAMSHHLMPKGFSKIGLAKTLEESIRKVSRPGGIAFDFVGIGQEHKLPATVEMQIFRITTALVNNILKHSGATEATIQLAYQADHLTVMAEDNGQGFAYQLAQTASGGLRNLRARAEFIGAEVTIDTHDTGTTIVVQVPYQPNQVLPLLT
jgi:two-component system, sensor histidine kinase LadS